MARRSCAELATILVTLAVVTAITASTVWRQMHNDQLKPRRFRLWQRSRDSLFLQRAKPALELYAQASELLQHRVWLVCADEKTLIQVREDVDEPQPPLFKPLSRRATLYYRCEALNLFAALSVADGKVVGCCRRRKRFVDVQVFVHSVLVHEVLRRGVREIRLVLHNGSTHAPKQLEV